MSFEPLLYAWRSITLVHILLLSAIVILPELFPAAGRADPNPTMRFAINAILLTAAYFLFAPMVGQIFGDKYSFAQVWPSSAALGMVFTGILFATAYSTEPQSSPIGFLIVGFLALSLFLGLALNLFLYVAPRAVGWGIVEWPKAPWGVEL